MVGTTFVRQRPARLVQARSISHTDPVRQCASEKQLENLLRKADQSADHNSRATYMMKAVEVAEEMKLPMGHLGRIYDMSARAHVAAELWDDAEKYFLIAINRLVQSGVEPNSPQIIHISLQLSSIFNQKKEYAKARSGFVWCRDEAKKHLSEDDSLNAKAFYGLTLDSLGRFMYNSGHYSESIPLMKESIQLAQEIDPTDMDRIGVLKINFSSILAETGEVSEALEMLNSLISDENDVLTVQALVNKAIINVTKSEDSKAATQDLQKALDLANKADNAELVLLTKSTAKSLNLKLN